MTGKIIKGIAGVYEVCAENAEVYECKAKGIFRHQKVKPLVGDDVILEAIQEEQKTATIAEVLPRKSELIRPAVANVDQVMVVFAAKNPEPNPDLLHRFLILMTKQKLPVIIIINKTDLMKEAQKAEWEDGWRNTGYEIRFLSAREKTGIEEAKKMLKGKTTVMAGPSGVGKSTLVNLFQDNTVMETGMISEKIKRGKHTTRHTELICAEEETYILDTPGFSSVSLEGIAAEELKEYFPEFAEYEGLCRFRGCMHENEPDCEVKKAVEQGKIAKTRYEEYKFLYRELKAVKKYK